MSNNINLSNFELEAQNFAKLAVDNDKIKNLETAIFYYTEAVESILNAVRGGNQTCHFQNMAQSYISRAEELKKQLDESKTTHLINDVKEEQDRALYILNEALSEDEEGNIEEAMKLYEESISLLLKLASKASNETEKDKLRQYAKKALERAEILKGHPLDNQMITTGTVVDVNRPDNLTKTSQNLNREEIVVLKATSVINGRQYLPFVDTLDYKERFSYTIPFTDKDGLLALSKEQKAKLNQWMRPSEYIENPKMVMAVSCFSVKQTLVTDCSFVASIAVAAQYERRFKVPLITSIIFPRDRSGKCVYNPCGKYMVKLNINGVPRKIIIDDLLPMGRSNQLLCSFSNNRSELWVSLLEKAYMKVMGGYDFPGSNSNIDLHALTGWIPERIRIHKNDPVKFKADKEFKKLHEHFHKGNCLITVATGALSKSEEERAGLAECHAYAMLDIREVENHRLFLLKNPWSHMRWKGRFSDTDTANWTPAMQKALNYDLTAAQHIDNGVFWIDYESLQHFFDVILVNWWPGLYPYTTCVHDTWMSVPGGPKKDLYSVAMNPQYRLRLNPPNMTSPQSVWVHLTRHIVDKDDFAHNREFLAVLVYPNIANHASRIFYPHEPEPIKDGVRVNSPHYLVKMVITPSVNGVENILLISQYEKNNTISYTIRVYSTCPLSLTKLIDPYKYYQTVSGQWQGASAGGCPNFPTFVNNPVFQIRVDNTTLDNRIMVELKAPREYAVGFEFICVEEFNTSNSKTFKSKNSGDYRRGFLVCEFANISGGLYNIRVATYRPGEEGPFILRVGSVRKFTICQL